MSKKIMDVSRWQGSIDWAKVAGSVDGVMVRCLGTKNGKPYLDPYFEKNYAACKLRGIPVGIYWYSTATTKEAADAELAMLKESCVGKSFELPFALDVEDKKLEALEKGALTDLVAYQLNAVQDWGVYVMLYTYLSFAENRLYMGGAALKPFDVWLAAYRKKQPETDFKYGMWQYTSAAKVPGVTGKVDMSEAYKDYTSIITKKGLGKINGF